MLLVKEYMNLWLQVILIKPLSLLLFFYNLNIFLVIEVVKNNQRMTEYFKSGIYLLKEHRFVENNSEIYKIGKSDNIYNRVNQYPNGSIVYLMIESNNITTHETKLKELFNKTFSQENYYGLEYFSGELDKMIIIIKNYIIENITLKCIRYFEEPIKIERKHKYDKINIPKLSQELYCKPIQKKLENNKLSIKVNKVNEVNAVNEVNEVNEVNRKDNNMSNINNSNIICSDCGEKFQYISQLNRHKNSKKKCGKNKTLSEITCEYCTKTYATKNSLIRHYTVCDSKKKKNNNENMPNINIEEKEKVLDVLQIFIKQMDDGNNNEKYNKKLANTITDILSIITKVNK